MIKLPSWLECSRKYEKDQSAMTALELFIYLHEPTKLTDAWRADLARAVDDSALLKVLLETKKSLEDIKAMIVENLPISK